MTAADIWPITLAAGLSSVLTGAVGTVAVIYSRGRGEGHHAARVDDHGRRIDEHGKRIEDSVVQRAAIKSQVVEIDKGLAVLAAKVDGIKQTTDDTHELVVALSKRR